MSMKYTYGWTDPRGVFGEPMRVNKLPYGNLILMMEEKGQDVLRVCINDDGTFDIIDFTMPSLGKKRERNIPQEDVPKWILNTVSMLRVATEGDLVKGIGFKVSDRVYFISNTGGRYDGETGITE